MNIILDTSNDSFAGGNLESEIARILRKIAARIEAGCTEGKCIDANGNIVGKWEI